MRPHTSPEEHVCFKQGLLGTTVPTRLLASFRWWRFQDAMEDEQPPDNPGGKTFGGKVDLNLIDHDQDNAFKLSAYCLQLLR